MSPRFLARKSEAPLKLLGPHPLKKQNSSFLARKSEAPLKLRGLPGTELVSQVSSLERVRPH